MYKNIATAIYIAVAKVIVIAVVFTVAIIAPADIASMQINRNLYM